MRNLAFLPVLLLVGCIHVNLVHVNENSRTASKDQITDRLIGQLHCHSLELQETARDTFTGIGRNDTGPFTLTVTREKETIHFQGTYTGDAHGTFGGSASWSKHVNAAFGFHQASESSQTSLTSQ